MKSKPTANAIIAKHYAVSRPVTDSEVIDELVSLRRKQAKGNLDDVQERLVAELELHGMFSQKPASDRLNRALWASCMGNMSMAGDWLKRAKECIGLGQDEDNFIAHCGHGAKAKARAAYRLALYEVAQSGERIP